LSFTGPVRSSSGGCEGLVAKDEASVYESRLTKRWLKVKQKDWTIPEDRWQRRMFAEDR